jgi:hypothetical protein
MWERVIYDRRFGGSGANFMFVMGKSVKEGWRDDMRKVKPEMLLNALRHAAAAAATAQTNTWLPVRSALGKACQAPLNEGARRLQAILPDAIVRYELNVRAHLRNHSSSRSRSFRCLPLTSTCYVRHWSSNQPKYSSRLTNRLRASLTALWNSCQSRPIKVSNACASSTDFP